MLRIVCPDFRVGRVEVASVQAGWLSPLRVQGLKLRDKPSRDAQLLVEVDRITCSSGLWPMLQTARLHSGTPSAATAGTAAPATVGSGADSRGDREGIPAAASTGAAACGPVLVEGALFNCEFHPSVRKFKLMDWLEEAGLVSSADPPAASEEPGLPGFGGRSVEALAATADSSAPAVVSATDTRISASTSNSSSGAAGGDSDNTSRPSASAPLVGSTGVSTVGSKAAVQDAGRVLTMLGHADASMGFSADLKVGQGLQLLLPDAKLQVPQEIR